MEDRLPFTAQILAAAFTKPRMRRLSDLYGRVRMIVFGLALGGATMVLILLSSNYYAVFFDCCLWYRVGHLTA